MGRRPTVATYRVVYDECSAAPVFLNEDEYGQYSVIDGKQRLTTVSEFLTDRFSLRGLAIFVESNGRHFSNWIPPFNPCSRPARASEQLFCLGFPTH